MANTPPKSRISAATKPIAAIPGKILPTATKHFAVTPPIVSIE
jgi:hypothetical protein